MPAGTSQVEMWYESDVVDRSFLLSLVVLALLFVGLGAGGRIERMLRREPSATTEEAS